MSVLLVGLSHKTAPVEVREKAALAEPAREAALRSLLAQPAVAEACIVSTCNRVEFLVRGEPDEEAIAAVRAHLPLDQAEQYLYRYTQRDAIRHIFRVACSLDSMVVGEPQILGQVKDAYAAAKAAGTLCGPLEEILNRAFHVAKKVRTETGIGQMAVSVSFVAVELARKIFGNLDGHTVLILGSGKMSELAARHLRRGGAPAVFVANRTYERAVEMAARFDGRPVPFDQFPDLLPHVDIVISSTGAPGYILTRDRIHAVLAVRRNRPMFLIDIAVPRDIDPEIDKLDNVFLYDIDDLQQVAEANRPMFLIDIAVPRDIDPEIDKLDNVFLYDIDDLQQVAEANRRERAREADRAEEIVEAEVDRMLARLKTHDIAPTIVSLQAELERLRRSEIERVRGKLGDLTPGQQEAIEALTRGIVNKIAHTPITQLKTLAHHPDGLHIIDAIKRVFNLKEKA